MLDAHVLLSLCISPTRNSSSRALNCRIFSGSARAPMTTNIIVATAWVPLLLLAVPGGDQCHIDAMPRLPPKPVQAGSLAAS